MRWKIAAINWGREGTVKFLVYLLVNDEIVLERYTYTHGEAFAYIGAVHDRAVARFAREVRS